MKRAFLLLLVSVFGFTILGGCDLSPQGDDFLFPAFIDTGFQDPNVNPGDDDPPVLTCNAQFRFTVNFPPSAINNKVTDLHEDVNLIALLSEDNLFEIDNGNCPETSIENFSFSYFIFARKALQALIIFGLPGGEIPLFVELVSENLDGSLTFNFPPFGFAFVPECLVSGAPSAWNIGPATDDNLYFLEGIMDVQVDYVEGGVPLALQSQDGVADLFRQISQPDPIEMALGLSPLANIALCGNWI